MFGWGKSDALLTKVFELLSENRRLTEIVQEVQKENINIHKRLLAMESTMGLAGGRITIPEERAAEVAAKVAGLEQTKTGRRHKSQAEVIEALKQKHGDQL